MKVLLIPALALCICSCSQAPKKFTPGNTAVVHTKITDVKRKIDSANKDAAGAKKSIAKARELGKGNKALVLELDQANLQIDNLTKSLLSARKDAEDAGAKLAEADAKTLKEFERANKMAEQYAVINKKYHRLKFPLCLIGAGIVGFLLWKFKIPLLALGWIGIGIMVASPLAVFGFLWLLL